MSIAAAGALLLAAFAVPLAASAYGPSTMYEGAAQNPGYSRAVQLHYNGVNNGKMLAIMDDAIPSNPSFPVMESTNSGENWTRVGTVSDTKNGWGLRYQPHMIELSQPIGDMPTGTLLVAGNSIPTDLSATKIDLYKSNDIGRTWTFVSSIATGGAANPDSHNDPVWEPFLLVANNKLIAYYSDERDPAHNQKLVHQTSTNGRNWGSVVTDVALTNTGLRPGMATLAQMADGRWIMTYEVMPLAGDPVHYQISSNPEVWNPTDQGTYIASGGAPYVTTMPNGKVVVSILEHSEVFTNSANGTGAWSTVPTPLVSGYSRSVTAMDNGRLFLTTGNGRNVLYADVDAGGTLAKFVNKSTGRALDNTGSVTPATDVAQWTNVASDNLVWDVKNAPDGNLTLRSVTGGDLYLDSLGRTKSGQNAGQTTGGPGATQQWNRQYADGYLRLVNRANALALDTGGLNADGAKVQMKRVAADPTQQWTMVPQN